MQLENTQIFSKGHRNTRLIHFYKAYCGLSAMSLNLLERPPSLDHTRFRTQLASSPILHCRTSFSAYCKFVGTNFRFY